MYQQIVDKKPHDNKIFLRLTRTLPHGHHEVGDMEVRFYAICLLNGTMIGTCNIQLGHDPRMLYLGNLGYGIWEEYRGHRYSLHAAKLLCEVAKAYGMTELYLTSEVDNAASIRICELLGAEYVETLTVPEDHSEYRKGARKKHRYRLTL